MVIFHVFEDWELEVLGEALTGSLKNMDLHW